MKSFAALFIGFSLFVMSCNRNSVGLQYTNATGEVPVLGNLTFRFSKELASDSMLNRWDSISYIRFSPAIAGRFRWESKDQLVFSPSGPLLPATSYTANFKKDALLGNSEYTTISSADEVAFKTPDLILENQFFSWTKTGSSNQILPQLELLFNYPISPEQLQRKIEVLVDEKPVIVEMQTLNTAAAIKCLLSGMKVEDRDYKVTVRLLPGLLPEGGNNGLSQKLEYAGILQSPFVLLVNEVETEHDGNGGTINVRTNQTLSEEAVGSFMQIEPKVNFTVQKTDNGFLLISPDFSVASSYMLTLKKGLRGSLGGTLKNAYITSLTFGELEPALSFTNNKAVYLSAAGQRNIELNISNVPTIKLVVSKVYESNLLAAQKYGYYPKSNQSDGEEDYYYYEGEGDAVMGDVLYEQTIDTRSLPKRGANRLLTFNPDDKLPGYKGIYHISVRSTKDYWISSSRFIALSDIGLIAKAGGNKMLVFANSIQSAGGLSGVGLQVYGANNQMIGNGSTNSEGVAEITLTGNAGFGGFKPAMVVAKLGDDFNYLPFSNTRVNTSRYAVGGKKINATGLDAYVVPERDMYRPGETIRFGVILRDGFRKNPGPLPVKIKMLLPNGKELMQLRKTLDAEGVTEAAVSVPVAAITGTYLMELYNGNDVLITTYNFRVEEFVPDRIKVTTKLDKETLKPGSTASLSIDAVNYFGPPAAGRNYEMEIQVKEKAFNPEGYGQYQFNLSNRETFFDKIVRQGKTDATGKALEAYTVPEMYSNMGLLQARFFATVFDENGRPVSRNTTVDILTQQVLVGVASSGYNYFSLNQPAKFRLIALNPQASLVSAQTTVTVIKHEYRTVLQKSGSYFRYDSQREEKQLQKQQLSVQGKNTEFNFIPREAGEYELRIALPGADTYVSQRFYSYGSWGSNTGDFEVNSDGEIDITLDKNAYKTGDKVKVLFKAPFDGRLLVTLETNEVLTHQFVEIQNRTGAASFDLNDTHLPNAYITATLFKAHTISDLPLTAAHGFANVPVTDISKRLPVSIQASATSRSEKKQTVMVKAKPGSMVNLAAVDNGILAVSGFRTPDPYEWYFSKRALEVEAWDLYPLLFPELRRTMSSTGGDGDLSMNMRQNPIPNKRFKLLSYWSGWQKVGSSGSVRFEVGIPSFSGQVRLMAVGVQGDQFGASEATMQVADPLVVSTAMPRFMSPGDTVMVGVTLSNTTTKIASVSAKIATEGPLSVVNTGVLQATVAPNSETRIEFPVYAQMNPGAAKLKVSMNALGEQFGENIDITVRPASTLQKRSGSGVLVSNAQANINIPVADFMNGTEDYELMVSRSPVLQLARPLQYLVNYPYGCTEQVISMAFPQLYVADLGQIMKNSGGDLKKSANASIAAAIQRIKMRQLYNGGLTLWDGNGTEQWWVTAYAAHFLVEARKAGYAPDAQLLETMLQYLGNQLRHRNLVDYYYNQNQQKRIAPKEVAYSLYVLALAGKPNISAMNYYKANQKDLALDSRYVLSATYALAGDKKSFREMLPASFSGEVSVPVSGGSFYSTIRDEGLALNVLLEVDPGNAQVPLMAKHIVEKLNSTPYLSTQEAVFGLLALGKMAKSAAASDATATVSVNGKAVGKMDGSVLKLNKRQLGTGAIQVAAKGKGSLYYWWQASGVSSSGKFVEEDSYLKVRRQLFNRNGQPLTGNTFRQNDLIVVKVVLEKAFNGRVENIVVTDLLPGGWEIENERIKDVPGMDWIKDETTPLSRDVRDDRIHIFTDLGSNRQVFYYSVRAVTPGTYRAGPLSADAMYQGEYHSYSGAGVIRVDK